MDYLVPEQGLIPDEFNSRMVGTLPGHLGFSVTSIDRAHVTMGMAIGPHHMAPNGFLHGGTVVALADTVGGFSTVANLRPGEGFTTIELKTNFLSTVRDGAVDATSQAVHIGGTTQVWDVVVSAADTGKRLALFRCTQLVLKPRGENR